jgi:hypothetical protein
MRKALDSSSADPPAKSAISTLNTMPSRVDNTTRTITPASKPMRKSEIFIWVSQNVYALFDSESAALVGGADDRFGHRNIGARFLAGFWRKYVPDQDKQ